MATVVRYVSRALAHALAGLVALGALSFLVRLVTAVSESLSVAESATLVIWNVTVVGATVAWAARELLLVVGERRGGLSHPPLHRDIGVWVAIVLVAVVASVPRVVSPFVGVPLPLISEAGDVVSLASNMRFVEERGGTKVTLQTNAFGFRERPWPETPETEPAVLLVGDSFVFGSGIAEGQTLGVLLQAALRKKSAAVYNAGVPGLNLSSFARMTAAICPKIRPQIVLVALSPGNDLEPVDPWRRLDSLGNGLFLASALLLVERDLSILLHARHAGWSFNEREPPAEIKRQFRADIAKLRQITEECGAKLMVLSWFGRRAWMREQDGAPLPITTPWREDWYTVRRYVIHNDGHPTAAMLAKMTPKLAADIALRLRTTRR